MNLLATLRKELRAFLPIRISEAARQATHSITRWRKGDAAWNEILRRHPIAGTDSRAIAKLIRKIKRRPELLLNISHARGVITRERFKHMTNKGGAIRLDDDAPHVADNALQYNLDTMAASLDSERPEWLIYPLMGIEQIRQRRKSAEVLSVGPRGEFELFTLQIMGFRPEKIRSLDLFSYSPLTDIGDMHAMPYPDASFDVIVLAWVWSYSSSGTELAAEIQRVARKNAIVCLSADNPGEQQDACCGTGTRVYSCDDMLNEFGNSIRKVYFRQDSDMPDIKGNIAIFELS